MTGKFLLLILQRVASGVTQTNGPFRFPGSQPVSFGAKDLAKLENQE